MQFTCLMNQWGLGTSMYMNLMFILVPDYGSGSNHDVRFIASIYHRLLELH
jgi:hypothetical protein